MQSVRPELALSEFVAVIEVLLAWVQAYLCCRGTDVETGLGTASLGSDLSGFTMEFPASGIWIR